MDNLLRITRIRRINRIKNKNVREGFSAKKSCEKRMGIC